MSSFEEPTESGLEEALLAFTDLIKGQAPQDVASFIRRAEYQKHKLDEDKAKQAALIIGSFTVPDSLPPDLDNLR